MNRRIAIRNVALTIGGLVLLPACEAVLFLSSRQEELLAGIVDTIIPATDTLGAKDLNVDAFVKKVVEDCYEKQVQDNFARGLDRVDKLAKEGYGKSFLVLEPAQRLELLAHLEQAEKEEQKAKREQMEPGEQPEEKPFFLLVKELTILGYTSSEYVQTNFLNYNMVPGHYYGCVPVSSKNTQKQS
jgi:hypothetical protein